MRASRSQCQRRLDRPRRLESRAEFASIAMTSSHRLDAPIVHIGYHKTATTWFQKNLYPFVRNASYLDRRLVRDAFLNMTAFTFAADRARHALRTSKRPIISEEDLCGYPENGGLLETLSKDVASRIHATYPNAQIVVFIRSQLDMIRSTYLQYVRSGGTHSLRHFLFPYQHERIYRRRWYKKPMLTLEHFDYQHLLRHYRQLFGAANVHVFCYEAFAADRLAFVSNFAAQFGLDIDVERLNYGVRNESLGMITLQLARMLGPFSRWETTNRLTILPIIPKWLPKAGLKALNKTPLAGPRVTNQRLFGERLGSELQAYFATGNQALVEELGLPLREFGYPLPLPRHPARQPESAVSPAG